MKKVLLYLLLMFISVLIGTIFSIFLFHTKIFSNMHVLMYRGIFIIFLTGIVLFFVLLIVNKILNRKMIKINEEIYNIKDIISIVIVFLCVNIAFFTLVPVTVERSVSVFTLAQIEKSPNETVTKEEAEKMFNDIYIERNDAFGKRFDEQLVTGSIKKNDDGSYTLTEFGNFLVDSFRFIGKLYNADCKNLY